MLSFRGDPGEVCPQLGARSLVPDGAASGPLPPTAARRPVPYASKRGSSGAAGAAVGPLFSPGAEAGSLQVAA